MIPFLLKITSYFFAVTAIPIFLIFPVYFPLFLSLKKNISNTQ
ncbi:hypothetical protein CLOSTMETH_03040 [[Clostridium] methylpentosum DSM 5476]|uniref:Uncharacterized protein n=1 Tax=[Clostridium] methylpentosum DSM 5476 TaxID=537013 RepID=C0EGP7_9FIRM|nr:hypothetical protein CLOSTMETH_03040 [[Clostridium] methylpentosum DSM 5476]